MKKIGLILLSCVFAFGVFAQENVKRIKLGNKKYIIISEDDGEVVIKDIDDLDDLNFDFDFNESFKFKKKRKKYTRLNGHWNGLEIGLNTFANKDFDFDFPANADFMEINKGKSIGFNLNCGEKNFGIIGNYVGFVTGWGFEFNHYSFSNNITLDNVNDVTVGITDTINDFYRNRLSSLYLTVPLMLEFQIPVTGESKRIYLSAGVVGGLRLHSRMVQKYKTGDDKVKNKVRDDFNLNGFRYGLTARVGYGDFGFYATYNLNPLFKDNAGPELYPLTFGITLSH